MNLESIHHEHTRLSDQLAEVSENVRAIRDEGIFDPARFREVHRFIREVALPHMEHEEAHLFPLAAAAGLPPEVLEFLRRDHEELRILARRAMLSGLDGESAILRVDASLMVDRFVLAFDEHARREESLFCQLTRGR
jgi:hemerythrin-like domain-containing protein